MLDCQFRLAQPNPQPSAILPRSREVRIERKSLVNECRCVVEITCDAGKHEPGRSEGKRVIPAQLRRLASQLFRLLDLGQAIGHPPISHACFKAHRRRRMGQGVVRVQLHRLEEMLPCVAKGVLCVIVSERNASHIVVVRIEAVGWLMLCALKLRQRHFGYDRADHARGHLILKTENVSQCAIKALRPKMHALGSVDELPSKSYPVPRPAHTAFKQIPHPQLMPHLLRVDIAAPVGEAGITRDHEQVRKA